MRTGLPRASRRATRSASGIESAAAGIFGWSLSYCMPPVWGSRSVSVPIERTRAPTAPYFAAREAPLPR